MLRRKLFEKVSAADDVLRLLYTRELLWQVVFIRYNGGTFGYVEVWNGFKLMTDGGEVNLANESDSVAWC